MFKNNNNTINKKGLLIEHDGYFSLDLKDNKKILKEFKEAEHTDNGSIKVTAILQKSGVENRNGRIYPDEVLKKVVKEYQTLIDDNNAVGESNHPDSTEIDLDRISHNITKVWWEDNVLYGTLELITSPGFEKLGVISCEGDRIVNYLKKGLKIGVSSRGIGSLKKIGGKNIVDNDYELVCWDIVTQPSTPGAWILGTQEAETEVKTDALNENNEKINGGLDNFLLD